MARQVTTKRVLLTSFGVDLVDFVTNVIVAIFTGSAIMLVEAMQGLADLTAVFLLILGFKRSRRHPTKKHPYGFGKEQYFWAVISAFIIFAVTATLSFYFGYQDFKNPEPVHQVWLAYAILCLAIATNGYAFLLSAKKLLNGQPLTRLPKVFLESPQIGPKTTTVLDLMGATAAAFGFVSLIIYGVTGDARWDGIGAMAMGVILAILAFVLLVSVRGLVTGQSAGPETEKQIIAAAQTVPQVTKVFGVQTMLLGSDSTLVNIEVNLKNRLSTDQVESVTDAIQKAVQKVGAGMVVHVEIESD